MALLKGDSSSAKLAALPSESHVQPGNAASQAAGGTDMFSAISTAFNELSQGTTLEKTWPTQDASWVSPDDLGDVSITHSPDGALTNTSEMLNSPQRLRASSWTRLPPRDSVEGTNLFVRKIDPKSPLRTSPSRASPSRTSPSWTSPSRNESHSKSPSRESPGKKLDSTVISMPLNGGAPSTAADKGCALKLTATQKFLASQLANLEVDLAAELVSYADKQRLQRVRGRIEKNLQARKGRRSSSMRDAVNLIVQCRGQDPFTPMEAEDIVRARLRKTEEHPLHVYGFLFHLALYPLTMILALLGYMQIGLSAVATVRIESGMCTRRTACVKRAFLQLVIVIIALPMAFVCVFLCVVPDIILLLTKPVLPLRTKLAALQWFFPSSLAFWSAGTCGYVAACAAHILLGSCPVDDAFISTSLGGQLCNKELGSLPPSSAFQAAVVCAPHFLSHRKFLRSTALKGIPEFYAPAGGALAKMPSTVQWAYLLGDRELCAAWEAECMGQLSQMQLEKLPPVGLP